MKVNLPEHGETQGCDTPETKGQDQCHNDLRGDPHPDDFISGKHTEANRCGISMYLWSCTQKTVPQSKSTPHKLQMWAVRGSRESPHDRFITPRSDMEVPEEPLLEDGIPPSFPDDQICNLLDHDGNKESRITCVF